MSIATLAAQDNTAAVLASLNGAREATATKASVTREMSDRFLKLLVTQLRNQDPLNPMENAELTMQLAQMSTVEGIASLNEGMRGLVDMFRASQVLQGAALVGRQVLAEGNLLGLGAAGAVAGVELDGWADGVRISILDAGGGLVRSLDLGAQEAGLVRFVWDGRDQQGNPLAQGDYRFLAEAEAAGRRVAAVPHAVGQVLSVSLAGAGMQAEVSGLGMRGFAQIKQIY